MHPNNDITVIRIDWIAWRRWGRCVSLIILSTWRIGTQESVYQSYLLAGLLLTLTFFLWRLFIISTPLEA